MHSAKRKNLKGKTRKHYRWLLLYLKQVKAVEDEIGGELYAC